LWSSALIDASGLGLGYPFGLPFPAQVGFELCEDTKHVQKRLSGRAGGIYRLFGSFQARTFGLRGPKDILATCQPPIDVVRVIEAIAHMMARSDHEAENSLHNSEDSGSDEPGKEAS
jgi:hypothetical protein